MCLNLMSVWEHSMCPREKGDGVELRKLSSGREMNSGGDCVGQPL